MYAVQVKSKFRSKNCEPRMFWVRDRQYPYYVHIIERGIWETREQASRAINDLSEEVVYVGQ